MTTPSKADVLRIAKECGLGVTLTHSGEVGQFIEGADWTEELERFAAAMYAAGAESAKAAGWRQCAVGQHTSQFCGQLEAAVAAEREVSDKLEKALKAAACDLLGWHRTGSQDAEKALAEVAAIRSKGEKQ